MSSNEQGVQARRYQVVPRTLIFLRRGESYLLLRGAADKKRFAGLYNGIGGHIERGESALTAARRELEEETGLQAALRLVGTLLVDVEPHLGVLLFVFTGQPVGGQLRASAEGRPEWIAYDQLHTIPAVPDLLPLLQYLHGMSPTAAPFSARSGYDASGRLQVIFD